MIQSTAHTHTSKKDNERVKFGSKQTNSIFLLLMFDFYINLPCSVCVHIYSVGVFLQIDLTSNVVFEAIYGNIVLHFAFRIAFILWCSRSFFFRHPHCIVNIKLRVLNLRSKIARKMWYPTFYGRIYRNKCFALKAFIVCFCLIHKSILPK